MRTADPWIRLAGGQGKVDADGYTPIFDGKTLQGWSVKGGFIGLQVHLQRRPKDGQKFVPGVAMFKNILARGSFFEGS
ncbi:MAG: hypothetical protein IKC27_09630 [Kiritimatiellae bacterium]|nr:hypothetical protein [Kiritimatiellia bacterium]